MEAEAEAEAGAGVAACCMAGTAVVVGKSNAAAGCKVGAVAVAGKAGPVAGRVIGSAAGSGMAGAAADHMTRVTVGGHVGGVCGRSCAPHGDRKCSRVKDKFGGIGLVRYELDSRASKGATAKVLSWSVRPWAARCHECIGATDAMLDVRGQRSRDIVSQDLHRPG